VKEEIRLGPGSTMPYKASYWLIWVLDVETRKPYHSRATFKKWLTPEEACQDCYGREPTRNMLFFNLSNTLSEASKRTREIAKLYHTYVDK
jgi:hypothetical protein